MKNLTIIACLVILVAACNDDKSGKKLPMKSTKDSFSYAFGAYTGGMLNSTNIKEVNWEVFKAAFEQALKTGDTGLALDRETIGKVLNAYANESKYGENKTKGSEYIAKHKADGFTVTASGLLFKQIKGGNGVKPNITDTVLVHYTGKYVDGTVFDSNVGKDAFKTALNAGAIPGFLEALSMMEEGSEAEIIVPYDLAYGEEGSRNPYTGDMSIEPYQTLNFILTLDSIKK